MRNGLQDFSASQQSQGSSYPFEAAYEQPLQAQSSPYAGAYPAQGPQYTSAYRGTEYPPQAQSVQQGLPAYAEQMQQQQQQGQQESSYQPSDNQIMQQLLQNQQFDQRQLLMDLYKSTPGQGRAVTNSPGRSQPFYTADQYINFLNKQHQDVFQQQQNITDRGYSFSPMSSYTDGVPATNTSPMNYSPASDVSRVNYSNGKLSYNF